MRSSPILFASILILVLFLIDLYVFKGIKVLTVQLGNPIWKKVIHLGYWVVSAGILTALLFSMLSYRQFSDPANYVYFYFGFGLLLLFLLPKLVFGLFHLTEDVINLILRLFDSFSPNLENLDGRKMKRLDFLSKIGIILAGIPFISVLYGMLYGRFNFRVFRNELSFERLPKEFDGYKVVQISDLHLGSFFNNHKEVERGIKMINDLKPDLILFTGDLVNNYAKETEGWASVFRKLEAKDGKLGVLGNHDYGYYGQYETEDGMDKNFEAVKSSFGELGFDLVLNDHRMIERKGKTLKVLGVENWGEKPFPQFGDLNKSKENTTADDFKILMSHDPSHWDAEVKKHSDIDLTLSGHTHGMQFGVEIGNFKWSPVKYRYPKWAGLYQEENRYLYVNRGFGYIGFPGRVGISPEISYFELRSA